MAVDWNRMALASCCESTNEDGPLVYLVLDNVVSPERAARPACLKLILESMTAYQQYGVGVTM